MTIEPVKNPLFVYVSKNELGKDMTLTQYQSALCAYQPYANAIGLTAEWHNICIADAEDDLTAALAMIRQVDVMDDIGDKIRRELVDRASRFLDWRFADVSA
jgi:hypothetical protein